MLSRTLEPEAMDTPVEAIDYDTMDHGAVNRLFVDDLLDEGIGEGPLLDLGTGTAQIPIELCGRKSHARVVAIDIARSMLDVAERNVAKVGFADRIELTLVDAKTLPLDDGRFDTVMSNSIVHHIAEPLSVLREAWRVLCPGGLIFFRDLYRPADRATLARLVDTYAAEATDHQRQMLTDSFHASLSLDEIRDLIGRLEVDPMSVRMTSDRHWTWAAKKTGR